jgi:hypothetical protein
MFSVQSTVPASSQTLEDQHSFLCEHPVKLCYVGHSKPLQCGGPMPHHVSFPSSAAMFQSLRKK